MQFPPASAARRLTWPPGRRLRIVLLATSTGSVLGLVFGLSSLNRPILNAAVFYVVGLFRRPSSRASSCFWCAAADADVWVTRALELHRSPDDPLSDLTLTAGARAAVGGVAGGCRSCCSA